jgi:mono/diheme cytochrome c family protein
MVASEMKRPVALLALGLVIAGFHFTTRTSEGAATAAPVTSALAGDAAAGKATFRQYCSICHGAGARGFIGPSIAGVNWTTPGLHAIVRGGLGGYGSMPAFNADAVTDRNIADIAAYLVSLAPASAPQASSTAQVSASAEPAASPASSGAPAASPASSVAPPVSSGAGDAVHGGQIYATNCAVCHGANAQGGIGPSLRGEKTRKNSAAAIAWIKNPLPPMPKLYPSVLSEKDVEDVAAYVESL